MKVVVCSNLLKPICDSNCDGFLYMERLSLYEKLSENIIKEYVRLIGKKNCRKSLFYDIPRNDETLIKAIEKFVKHCYNDIKIVEIPDGVEFEINVDSEGNEYICSPRIQYYP